jgi:hypothetical protein
MKNPMFKIEAVKVIAPYQLAVTFGDKVTMHIDFAGIIDQYPALFPLKDSTVFAQAHVNEFGSGIVWTDEIDLAGDNLRAEAVEQAGDISHERIWNWMHRNKLTLDTAAEALGISRRMVAYYRNGEKPIPKNIWLACLGWEHYGKQKKAA